MRFSSLALRRHLERLAPSRAVTSGLPNITPRISSSALQHLQVRQPFFFTPTFGRSAVKSVPSSTEAHSQGLATLSVSVLPTYPRKPLSAPYALGLRSSELFSSPGVMRSFQTSLSTLALFRKTSRPSHCASVAFSPQFSRALLLLPDGLNRVRAFCSPELSNLSGFSLRLALEKVFSTFSFPSRFFLIRPLRNESVEPSGFFALNGLAFPSFEDASPSGFLAG